MRSEKNQIIREILPMLTKESNYKGEVWYDIPHCSYSDYSGHAVEVSNAKYFEEKYRLGHRWGYYSSRWTLVGIRDLFGMTLKTLKAFTADLESLENYPVMDEELLSAVENENRETCIKNGSFDLASHIRGSWKRIYPIEVLHAILEDKDAFTLEDYCRDNLEALIAEFSESETIEYSGGSKFCLNWYNCNIPRDLLPQNNGYSQVSGIAINGKTLKGWVK
jgi:hypothetical protein